MEEQEMAKESQQIHSERLTTWKTKRDNLWDSQELEALREGLHKLGTEQIGGRCANKDYHHLTVWAETCGGVQFMQEGMRPHWMDEEAPRRLGQKWNTVEYTFDASAEEAFLELIAEELKEGIVMEISIDQARFLNPVFMVKKHTNLGQKQKWIKVVDCRALNAEQRHIHFRMDGAETVQSLARQFDWATSLDLMNAFNHMKVEEAFQPYLCFMHRGRCYKYLAMPFGARHSPRIFTRALGYPSPTYGHTGR
jgi:hypothetical protein